MQLVPLSVFDINKLRNMILPLENINGVTLCYSTENLNDLGYLHGQGYFILCINKDLANKIWETVNMPKEGVYSDIMTSIDLKLYCSLYKLSSFFKSVYFIESSINFGNMQVYIGSTASTNINGIIENTINLLLGIKEFPPSSKEALKILGVKMDKP